MRSYPIITLSALLALSLMANLYLLPFYLENSTGSQPVLLPISTQKTTLSATKYLNKITNEPNLSAHKLNQLFMQSKYNQAISGLAPLSDTKRSVLMQQWLHSLEELLQQKQTTAAHSFARAYLKKYPQDRKVMQLLAKAHIIRGDLLYGLELYYQLATILPPNDEQQLLSRLHSRAIAEIKRLSKDKHWSELSYFVTPLLDYEADFPPYLLAKARADYQLKAFEDALLSLATITTDPDFGAQASKLEADILSALSNLEAIALTAVGAHFVVTTQINRQYPAALMIDTGASLSVLSKAYFEHLGIENGIELLGNRKISTAGGEVNAPVYRFESLSINQYQVANVEFVILELSNMEGSQGLLGMNFLQNYKFEIDQEARVLLLEKR